MFTVPYQEKIDKILFFVLVYLVFTLPYSIALNSIGIIVFSVGVLARLGVNEIYRRLKCQHYLFIGFYLLYVLGMLYTDNFSAGAFELEKKLSLIIFPIFLGVFPLTRKQIAILLLCFIGACLSLLLYMLTNAVIKYFILDTSVYFFSGRLSQPGGGIHRAYFAMYLLFGIVSSIHLAQTIWRDYWWAFLLIILIFSIIIFLLSARMCFIIYIILLFRYLYYFIFVQKKYGLGAVAIVIFLLSMASIFHNPMMIDKLEQLYKNLDKGNTKRTTSSVNLRIMKWKCAWALYTRQPWIGVGTGDVSDELVKEYTRINFYWGIKDKYNAHNQYLETALALGSVGLLFLIIMFAIPAVMALKHNYVLYAEFIFIFAGCCLAESMFNAQKGVVFYSLFNGILLSATQWSVNRDRK